MEQEEEKQICIREINDNIKRIFNKEPLTQPLARLNAHCEFKKRYELAFDLKFNVRKCLNCRKEFKDINECGFCSDKCKKVHKIKCPGRIILSKEEKAMRLKMYYQRPEDKAKHKEYRQRPEVKARIKEYNQRPEVKAKHKEYHIQNKDKISKRKKEWYIKNKK